MPDSKYFKKIFQAIPEPVVVLTRGNPAFIIAYVNKAFTIMTGISEDALIGHPVLEFIPHFTEMGGSLNQTGSKRPFNRNYVTELVLDDEGHAIATILIFEHLDKGNVLPGTNRNATFKQQKEQQLKLMESIVTNTGDSVLVTEAGPLDEQGDRIVYVNNAFTMMTGYSLQDVQGSTPRILQGIKTDRKEMQRLRELTKIWQPFETTVINYKKTGEEFWVNFSLTPVADETGWFTHWISIERDVTRKKNEELEKKLLADISELFNAPDSLNKTLEKVLHLVADFSDIRMAEVWLVSTDGLTIHMASHIANTLQMQDFYRDTTAFKRFHKGKGFPGVTWEKKSVQVWQVKDQNKNFTREVAAKKAGLKSLYGVPLMYNNEIIGVFLFGLHTEEKFPGHLTSFFESLGKQTGIETRRKQLEQELNQIFHFAPDIICVIGWDGFFKKINPAACLLLEYTEAELLSVPIIFFVHPDDQHASQNAFTALRKGKPTFYLENRCVGKSGKIKWLAWTAGFSPADGTLFAVAKDITEKKNLENLLKKANALARIGSWEVDVVNKTLYWSDITKEIHEAGYDFTPDINTAIEFYKEGESRNIITASLQKSHETGEAFDTELQIVTKRGNEKWIRAMGEAEMAEGQPVRIYGSFQDIDKQKRDELAISRVLKEKNTILESIGDGFFAVDKEWNATYWNSQAEAMLNIPKTAIIGQNVWQKLKNHLPPLKYARYLRDIVAGKTVHFETYLEDLYKWFSVSAYPADQGLSVYFRDITENKIAELNLMKMNVSLQKQAKDLAVSNAELEQFAYVASHDLQEPLRMITSYLTQIEKKYGETFDEKGKKYVFFAVDGAKRMRQIILDLLEYSRAGRSQHTMETVDLNEIVKEVVILFRKQIEEKKAVINAGKLPVIRSVTSPIRQVFQNLIGNALKYSRPEVPVEICITYTETEKNWEFAIRDNGIGIEKEFFEKIFIIFQRLHTREEYSGTGLGLAITKKIIDNLGGNIWVESEARQGTTFYFTLMKNMS